MTFRQTDAGSVVTHLSSLSDEAGVLLLHQMAKSLGWGPNTRWDVEDEVGEGEKPTGQVYTLLSLSLNRPTPRWFEALQSLAPLTVHAEEWRLALQECTICYDWDNYSVAGSLRARRTTQTKSADHLSWSSPEAWAVVPVLRLQKLLNMSTPGMTWSEQIRQASEALGIKERRSRHASEEANWEPYWNVIKEVSTILGVSWPGSREDWLVDPKSVSWLATGKHAWDQVAIMLDAPGMLGASWVDGAGHDRSRSLPLILEKMPEEQRWECSALFSTAIGHDGPGALRCLEWSMRNTDVLDAAPKGAPMVHWNGTWREALVAAAADVTGAEPKRQAYAAALSVLRQLPIHDPMPPSRRPRVRT